MRSGRRLEVALIPTALPRARHARVRRPDVRFTLLDSHRRSVRDLERDDPVLRPAVMQLERRRIRDHPVLARRDLVPAAPRVSVRRAVQAGEAAMTVAGIGQIVLYAVVLVGLGYPLGVYMARVYSGNARLAQRVLGPIER